MYKGCGILREFAKGYSCVLKVFLISGGNEIQIHREKDIFYRKALIYSVVPIGTFDGRNII